MKLADMRDNNGTSLQSYVELLAEKAQGHALRYVLILIDPLAKGPGVQDMNVVTNVQAGALPRALRAMAREMSRPAQSITKRQEIPS